MRRVLAAKPKERICLTGPKRAKMNGMEVQPITIQAILQWLQNQAAKKQTEVIIQTRIAINSQEARILDVRQEPQLATIRY
jgi:hypothetical protein